MFLREQIAEAEAHLRARPSGDAAALLLWHDRRAILLHALADRPPARQPDRLAFAALALRLLLPVDDTDPPAERIALAALAGLDAELDRLDLAVPQ